MKKISVCIPTYNQEAYVEACIRSVMAQTVLPEEIIVSNDCSTDNTKEILDRLAAEISILKVLHQPVNLGMKENTNQCLRHGKEEFILKLDSDDLLLPEYIEKIGGLLSKYKDAGYGHGNVIEIDDDGNENRHRKISRKQEYIDADTSLKETVKGYKVAANIIMFRREALEKVNYITAPTNFAEDFFLSVNIADAGYGNVFVPLTLSKYRVWNDSKNLRVKRKITELQGLYAVFTLAFLPAFQKRNWDLGVLSKARENFALRHASSLQSKVFTEAEKNELETALLNLSDSGKVKRQIAMYKNGFGFIPDTISGIKRFVIATAKKILS
ncbi:glycosyltransferase family 2 protein [Flavobacterium sp. RNTU_13]|uniref:glycosyltransferase family 2 protein n=1 Tax=Flavobacterium sp. RNTU_13 TaxID=3375145 RepID=UPI00398689BC